MSIEPLLVSRVALPRAQIHRVDVGVAVIGEAHDHLVAVGREARREGHAGKVAQQLLLPGVDIAADRRAGVLPA